MRTLKALSLFAVLFSAKLFAQCDCVAEPNTLGGAGTFTLGQDMNIGIPETKADQEYTWMRNGKPVKGPLSGDGGSKSFQFTLRSPEEAGVYTILTTKQGCKPTYFGNVEVAFTGPLPQTILAEPVCGNSRTAIKLASSEVDVTYQLQYFGTSLGEPVQGTGGELFLYTPQYGGEYTVVATGKGGVNVPVAFKEVYSYTDPGYMTGFNTSNYYIYPNCWEEQYISGFNTLSFMTSTSNPATVPYEGSRFVSWESNWYAAGRETRLVSPQIYNAKYASLDVEFFWYHNNNPLKSTGNYLNEGVQVQYSYDGYTWNNIGDFIPRHSSALPANTGAWTKKTISLGFGFGVQEPFMIGLKFRSEAGDNCSLDAFRIVETPKSSCVQPEIFFLPHLGSTSAIVSWLSTGSDKSYQYALLKENDPWPTNGTPLADTTVTLTGLQAGSQYTLLVRSKCGSAYSDWRGKTFVTLPGCETAPTVSLCTPVTASFPAGGGAWNFNGQYPLNGTGSVGETPGRERIYKFIPPSTGIYYVDVVSPATSPIAYLFKPASEVCCTGTNWTGIKFYTYENRGAIGELQAGKTYYLILDNSVYEAGTETFKICKATVSQPAVFNACSNEVMLDNIPANNPKEEHYIDADGVLLASIDFSSLPYEVSNTRVGNHVNGDDIRRDNAQQEYLDRNFTLSFYPYVNDSVKVKFYFLNAELQRLANEPNDAIADVTSIADLKITAAQSCDQPTADQMTTLFQPSATGTYDGTSGYLQFKTLERQSSYFLHGGDEALFGSHTICAGGTATFKVRDYGYTSYTYQWQVDNGSGFTNITNNTVYAGATTHTLSVKAPPTSYYGYKYRCVVSAWGYPYMTSGYKKLKFASSWTGATNTSWNTATNWACGVVPDANTDVTVPLVTNKPVITNNTSVRSIRVSPGSTLRVNSGYKLTIAGK